MADRSRRGLSFFPVLWAALRMSDSIAARGRVVGGYGLLFASQPPYVRAAVLFTDASAEPITAAALCPRSGFGIRDPRFYCFESRVRIAGPGAGLQPDQIRSRYVDDGQRCLITIPFEIETGARRHIASGHIMCTRIGMHSFAK